MDTSKIYHDIDGNELTIHQMVEQEPQWAAARIQAGEKAEAEVERLTKLVDINVLRIADSLSISKGNSDHNKRCAEGWMALARKAEAQNKVLREVFMGCGGIVRDEDSCDVICGSDNLCLSCLNKALKETATNEQPIEEAEEN